MHLKILEIFKPIVFAICLTFLTLESYELVKDYNNHHTVVTVNIEKQSVVEYPGVSVCEINHFLNLRQQVFDFSKAPVAKGLWIRAKRRNSKIFDKIVNNPMDYLFYAKFFLHGKIKATDVFGPIDDGFITCTKEATDQPCTPVNILDGYFSQCKTFFIHFNEGKNLSKQTYQIIENARDNEMAVITIKKNESNYYHTNEVTVLLTPSNVVPFHPIQKLSFRQNQLIFGRKYDLTFSKTTIIKIPNSYESHCSNYDPKNRKFNSYAECTIHCVLTSYFEKYNCLLYGLDLLFTDTFIQERRLCNYKETVDMDTEWFFSMVKQCFHQCTPECIQKVYNYKIKDVTDSASMMNDKIDNNTIIIKLLPKDNDEYTYIHQPKITRSDLLSKLGGLLSLWLGFSFYSIYRHIEKLIQTFLAKTVSFVVNIRFKLNFN